jgi:hypothetical protein
VSVQRIATGSCAALAVRKAHTHADIFNLAWAEGQTMTLDEAVAYALVSPALATDDSLVMSMNITDVTGLLPT